MAQSAMNCGLESLAAEASRRAESLDRQTEASPSAKASGSKSASQGSGQKGKVRKAYTITKQRERWTDNEHERFLQALKRYGRAWRKIEEHIGTKTAVQIRSHAQKFFSKLQREQEANGGLGDESSKAGISIPPPRPKRKPAHPYPRKTAADSTTDNACSSQHGPPSQQRTASRQPLASATPSSTPSQASLPPLRAADDRGGGDVSLSQILEAAAVAAASAWSQVVASAGSKVQQQLQAQLLAQHGLQGTQPLLDMSPAALYKAAQQLKQQQQQQPIAANLQSSSHHSLGKSPFWNERPPSADAHLASDTRLPQAQSAQDSPEGVGNAADTGNERDSACSKEFNLSPAVDCAASTGRQVRNAQRQQEQSLPRGSQAAWDALLAHTRPDTALAAQLGGPAMAASLARFPSRAFSAGPVPQNGSNSPAGQQQQQVSARRALEAAAQAHSNTSQLAHFFHRAAVEEQQQADTVENGSSGEGGGSSGDGSNGKLGVLRSEKGSNTGNSGCDEDANGNGSGSDNGNNGKGSDDGSNSPWENRNDSPSKALPVKPHRPDLFKQRAPDAPRTGPGSDQLQQQSRPGHQHATRPLPTQPRSAFQLAPAQQQAAVAALQQQQQALGGWPQGIPAPQSGLQLLQGIVSKIQTGRDGFGQLIGSTAPSSLGGDASMGNRTSSGVPSMDIFTPNSSRSHSMPLAMGTSNGVGSHPEEASGFKPYNKRHGMPVMSLPPAKRFCISRGSSATEAAGIGPPPDSI